MKHDWKLGWFLIVTIMLWGAGVSNSWGKDSGSGKQSASGKKAKGKASPPKKAPKRFKPSNKARLLKKMALLRAKKKRSGAPKRLHLVSDFLLDRNEVTAGEYQRCVEAGACRPPQKKGSYCNYGKAGRARHPINCVNWFQARSYCRWAGKRLPTAREWERAARGEEGRSYPWGNRPPSCQRAVYQGKGSKAGCDRDGTWPVGSLPAGNSADGIADLSGNVAEWVADCAARGEKGQCTHRQLRGGSWQSEAAFLRAGIAAREQPSVAGPLNGFRCALDAPHWLLQPEPATATPEHRPSTPPELRLARARPEPRPSTPTVQSYKVTLPTMWIAPCDDQCKNWDRFGGLRQVQLLQYRQKFRQHTARLTSRYCWPAGRGKWYCQSQAKALPVLVAMKVGAALASLFRGLYLLARKAGKYRPDPLVIIQARGKKLTFAKRSDTFSPKWTTPQKLNLKPGDHVTVQIFDKDVFSRQRIARFSFTFRPPSPALRHNKFLYIHNNHSLVKEFTLQFRK